MTGSIAFLAVTLTMLAIFGAIVFRTYRPERKGELEAPKHRMLDED